MTNNNLNGVEILKHRVTKEAEAGKPPVFLEADDFDERCGKFRRHTVNMVEDRTCPYCREVYRTIPKYDPHVCGKPACRRKAGWKDEE